MKKKPFPNDKQELNSLLDNLIIGKQETVNGLIVPHLDYDICGKISGEAFAKIKRKELKEVIIIGKSNKNFSKIKSYSKIETPLGKVQIIKNELEKDGKEESITNQIPFLQKINPKVKILPLIIGEINKNQAKKIVESFIEFNGIFIFTINLSESLDQDSATEVDTKSISELEKLNISNVESDDKNVLLILKELCLIKNWRPQLIEYSNSGKTNGEKSSVTGFASFWF